VSHLRANIDIVFAEKFSILSFFPRNPFALQQTRRSSLHCSVFLGRASIFGHEEINRLQDSLLAGPPSIEGGDGRDEPMSQLHTCLNGDAIEEIRNVLECGGGVLCRDLQFTGFSFGGWRF
jgi:hypothetical protein